MRRMILGGEEHVWKEVHGHTKVNLRNQPGWQPEVGQVQGQPQGSCGTTTIRLGGQLMGIDERRELIETFLRRCVTYADASIERKMKRGDEGNYSKVAGLSRLHRTCRGRGRIKFRPYG